jgi:hypothetical protein
MKAIRQRRESSVEISSVVPVRMLEGCSKAARKQLEGRLDFKFGNWPEEAFDRGPRFAATRIIPGVGG